MVQNTSEDDAIANEDEVQEGKYVWKHIHVGNSTTVDVQHNVHMRV